MQIFLRPVLVFFVAFIAALVFTPLVKRLAYRFNVLDRPNHRKIHTNPTPLMGGVVLFISFMLAICFSGIAINQIFAIFAVGVLFVGFGLLDDMGIKIEAKHKIFGHLIFSIAFIFLSGVQFGFFRISFLDWIVTACFITFMTNSMNMLDGMDGLVTGISALSAFFFFIIAINCRQYNIALFALALIGVTLGFLKYNFNPASIFLGESGSTFLGFLLARLIIRIGNLELFSFHSMVSAPLQNLVAVIIPLVVLGIPIFDTSFVFVNRFWNKIKFNTPGKDHSHHRLYSLGLSKKNTVLVLYGIQVLLGSLALILLEADYLQFVSILSIMLVLVSFLWFFLAKVEVYNSDKTTA